MSKTSYAKGGYCILNVAERESIRAESFCALENTQCPDHLTDFQWRSPQLTEDMDNGGFGLCTVSLIPSQSAASRRIHLGKCGEDKCAADEDSCDGNFIATRGGSLYEECQVNDIIFGDCNGRCVYAKRHCEEGEFI